MCHVAWLALHLLHHPGELDGVVRTNLGQSNYLFLFVWTADVLFWWINPERYETRPAWVEFGIHGYLFFIAINGAVIFESGVTRIGGTVAIVIFAVILLRRQDSAR